MATVNEKTERAPKGTAIPTLTFQEVIQIMDDLGERNVKKGDSSLLANVLNNSEGSSNYANKTIALRAYSVLTVDEDKNFELTPLGKNIAFPFNTTEKSLATQKAFAAHPILGRVWNSLKGKDLQPDYLPNLMPEVGGIPEFLKNEWSDYFIQAIHEAKLTKITPDGKEIVLSEFGKQSERKPEQGHVNSPTPPPPPPIMEGNADILEKLGSALTGGTRIQKKIGGSLILIYLGDSLTDDEAKQLMRFMDAGKGVIEAHEKLPF